MSIQHSVQIWAWCSWLLLKPLYTVWYQFYTSSNFRSSENRWKANANLCRCYSFVLWFQISDFSWNTLGFPLQVFCASFSNSKRHFSNSFCSPTSLGSLLGRCLDTGQTHVLWLVLYKHQTNEWEAGTDDPRHGQDSPPVVVLQEHCDQDRTQTPRQVHTAGEHRPPCSKLGWLIPLREDR